MGNGTFATHYEKGFRWGIGGYSCKIESEPAVVTAVVRRMQTKLSLGPHC
ncbi:hypothetical protein BDL97_10G048600 [Sphagnum fallax]|nr:hypothetical protein BDL97_10G048600 [Sphagnum fallax]